MAPRPAISALISDESVLLFPIGWFAKEQFHFFISHQWPRDIICGVDGYELGWPRSAFILYSSGDLAAIWKQCYCAYNLFADVFFWNPLWFQQSWEKPIYRQVSTMKSIRKFAKRPIPLPSPSSFSIKRYGVYIFLIQKSRCFDEVRKICGSHTIFYFFQPGLLKRRT